MRLILFFLLLSPIFASAQILRAYGVIEVGSLPTSSETGPKFAYRPADSSFYRWVSGSTWVKIIPDEPDTLYLKQLSGTTALVDGDTIDISTYLLKTDTASMLAAYIKLVGYGLIKTGQTIQVDTTSPNGLATRKYTLLNPTSILADRLVRSNGTNLVAGSWDDNLTRLLARVPVQFQNWTTAGRPISTDGYYGKNATTGFLEGYYTSQWENLITSTGASANQAPYFTSAGQIAGNSRHSITPSTGEQTITLNNAAGQADYIITASTPMSNGSTTINYGIRYYSSNQLWFGQLNNGSYIRWSGSGGQAALIGLWTFPTDASYPAPMHLGSDGSSGGDVRVTVLKSGNVANARINMYARRYGLANDAPSWTNGASFFQWGTMNAVTPWNQGYDTLRLKLNQNGDVQIGANTSGAADYTWSTNALLHVRGRQTSSQKIFRFDARSGTEYMNLTNSGNLNLFNVFETNKGGTVTIKNSSAATTSILGSGFIRLLKPSSGRFGGNFFINDTCGIIDNSFYLGQDDDGSIQAQGSGPQITHTFNNTKLPGQFRWAYAVRADTSMSIGTIRIVQGDRYASTTVPVTHRFYAGLQATETEPAYYFTSAASDGKLAFQLNSSLYVRHNGKVYFASDSTFAFNPSTDVLQLSQMGQGNKEAADLGFSAPTYIAAFAPSGTGQGTLLDYPLSSLVDGNGIYGGSGTLSQHTTRARIPNDGNFLISQLFNSDADSAYIQFINNLDGNREVRGGLTDTASTGFSKFRFYQDEADEEMGWEILTSDGSGTTTVGGQGGNLSLYADAAGTVEVRGQELRLNNGEVSMNQYGQGNMKASDVSATDSKFVAKFGDAGKVLDYYLARDTFIEDATLFSVGTLMNDCQELTVVSSMTATAPSHQEIRFPDAGDHLRGKKIIVYQKKKEAGIYVPQIKVVGGVSRLYFTTTPGIGGTDPSDQSTLSIDDSTWSSHGTTFEFTCLRIDNTPSYRWVLKQR